MDATIRPDVVIIGSGVGGGSVARQLAGSGAKVLILERGDFLPNEPENSDAEAVFVEARYRIPFVPDSRRLVAANSLTGVVDDVFRVEYP